jgi:hypothetical protein
VSDQETERLISVNARYCFENYETAARYIFGGIEYAERNFSVIRDLGKKVLGGLVEVSDVREDLYVTDGLREYQRPRGGFTEEGPVSFSVDFDTRFETAGVLIAHVEPWESNLLDRGLAWIALAKDRLSTPVLHLSVRPNPEVNESELAQRLADAETNATAMLEDMLSGVESPRFARVSSDTSR